MPRKASLHNYILGTPQPMNAALPHLWITCELQKAAPVGQTDLLESRVIANHNTLVCWGSQLI